MKILVTGICGFAGSVLVRSLLEHRPDLTIIGIDNLSRKGSETNIEPLRALGCDIRIGDVRDLSLLDSLPDCNWILDCAANPSVLAGLDGKTSSRQLIEHNLLGTINLLEFCKARRAAFVLLSTSRVYSIAPLASLPVEVRDHAFDSHQHLIITSTHILKSNNNQPQPPRIYPNILENDRISLVFHFRTITSVWYAVPLVLGLQCPICLSDFAKWAIKLAISLFRSSSEIRPIAPDILLLGKTVKCPRRNMLSLFNPLFSKSGSPFLSATSKPSVKFHI